MGVGSAPQRRLRGGEGPRRPGLRFRRLFGGRLSLSALPERVAGAAEAPRIRGRRRMGGRP